MNLPEAFIRTTKAILDNKTQEWRSFEDALNQASPVSIRFNPLKVRPEDTHSASINHFLAEPVSWSSNAYYLSSKPVFTLDPLFHAGTYYVQEASSMYLDTLIRQYVHSPVKALDLCAAPGGKSTLLSASLPPDSLLVANEVIHQRAHILNENLTKWGNPNTIVTNNDPAAFNKLKNYFDLLVADVPCSGEGMFRKDPKAIAEWSPAHVSLCAKRQRRIIGDVWESLKPGGLLIYSTCTYNKEENEENIAWIADKLGATVLSSKRFWPHQSKGEGLFIAALRKTGEAAHTKDIKPERKPLPLASDRIMHPEAYFAAPDNPHLAIPALYYSDYLLIKQSLHILSAGVLLGEAKGKDIIPSHALAMSADLNKEAFEQWELDAPAALHYLRKEALPNPPAALSRTHILITHQNHPLGFVKNIGNRANNLYPNEWRIRMKS